MIGKKLGNCLFTHCWGSACTKFSSILIGVDDNTLKCFDNKNDTNGYTDRGAPGIMGDPDRIIVEDDHIIFLSDTSSPQTSKNAEDQADFGEEAKQHIADGERKLKSSGEESSSTNEPLHVLLCGWREEWDRHPERFPQRVEEISRTMNEDSTLTCFNTMAATEFSKLLVTQSRKFKKKLKGENMHEFGKLRGITIKHYCGDPCNYADAKECYKKHQEHDQKGFTTAICLGRMVGKKLSQKAQDARIITMSLILRKLTSGQQKKCHLVAENRQDQTSCIGMAPTIGTSGFEPDFFNTQAIVARSLTMNLAYPQIQDAMEELIGGIPKSPEVCIVNAQELLCKLPVQTSFGALQHIINGRYKGRGIALGYFEGKFELKMCVRLGEKITWTDKHRVVAIVRDMGNAGCELEDEK
jgi:hypothetical protein